MTNRIRNFLNNFGEETQFKLATVHGQFLKNHKNVTHWKNNSSKKKKIRS